MVEKPQVACARLHGCRLPERCAEKGRCLAFGTDPPRLQCVWRNGCENEEKCRAAGRCLSISAQSLPAWPDVVAVEIDTTETLLEFHSRVEAAMAARLKLSRNKLVTMAADCDECHGKRCSACEDVWLVIDQLTLPIYLR